MPYRSVNPATGEVLKTFTEHTDQEMMDALATADKAFVSWAARPIEERAKIISRAAQLLLERKSELAKLATLEMGKRIAESRGEVGMEHAAHAPYDPCVFARGLARERYRRPSPGDNWLLRISCTNPVEGVPRVEVAQTDGWK